MKQNRVISGAVAALVLAALLAGCGTAASSSAATSEAASTAESTAAESTDLFYDSESNEIYTTDPIELTISWWGGDSRHAAYQDAIKEFQAEHSNITVEPTFAAWSGWEEKMAAAFIAGNAQDVCQINWNWLYSFTNADGSSKFYDLNQVADIIDLSQFDEKALAQCTIDGKLLAIPVAMTGRIFYWNKTTFEKAGLATPITLEELMAAGPIFAEKLGDDY